uniref:Cationic amino acid transporter C-terminal domain-containing protein n=1 Tax=Physcomitrium patens TaxID=3218 RepID=A0A7I4FAX4_PHYPA
MTGIGSTIGAGVYVLVGTVARERAGPALTLSFLIAGIAATLAALCYAELSSRCPSAGSAYHYAYTCVGEGVAWVIGWGLILEYTVGGSTVARGISPNLGVFVGGEENLPWLLMRQTIPETEIVVDPCAAFLVLVVTALLCIGIRESARVQAAMVVLNITVLLFVAGAGSYAGFRNGWKGYEQPDGYAPFGINGVLGGAATLFFAYIGFDTVASTAEEVKNPQRDLPLGIGLALFICAGLYILVSGVIVGLVPYNMMDPDTPMSTAFAENGMPWAMYIVAAGAVAALATTLMGSLLPQPRILMAMARDGLLPPFFSTVHPKTSVPVNGTLLTGAIAALMAFLMNVDELSGLVSVGTLSAFTIVSVCLLVLRYVSPPDTSKPIVCTRTPEGLPVVPKSPSRPIFTSQYPIFSPVLTILSEASLHTLPERSIVGDYASSASSTGSVLQDETEDLEEDAPMAESPQSSTRINLQDPLLIPEQLPNTSETSREEARRRVARLAICGVLIGVVLISLATAATSLPVLLRWALGSAGIPIFVTASTLLCLIEQDNGQDKFGQPGGFHCPWVPALPIASILVNVYLLVNLGVQTWLRVSVWMVLGVFVYMFYGMRHSRLAQGSSSNEGQADYKKLAALDPPLH